MHIRDAEVGDGVALAPNLREADKQEMIASTGESGSGSLERGIRDCDECWCAEVDGEPICLYGYRDVGDGTAFIWLMGSDVIEDVSWQFLRASKHTIKRLSKTFESLWSLSDARNVKHREWYEWLGFKVLDEVQAGPKGMTFNLIEWRNNHV